MMFDIRIHRGKTIPGLLQKMGSPEDVECTEHTIKPEANLELTFRIYHPNSPEIEMRDAIPTLLYVPGTGFNSLIVPGWSKIVCSHIAKKSGYQVIVLSHRLAPEYKFPTPIGDVEIQIKHIIQRASEYKIDKNNLSLGGYSSGGNIAAVVAEKLGKKQGKTPIKALYLISPMLNLARSFNAYTKDEYKDPFSEELAQCMISMYVGAGDARDPSLSPLWSPTPECLPNIIRLFVAEHDRFRGDTERFYEKIKKSTRKEISKFVFVDSVHMDFWYNLKSVETVIKFLREDDIQIPRGVYNVF